MAPVGNIEGSGSPGCVTDLKQAPWGPCASFRGFALAASIALAGLGCAASYSTLNVPWEQRSRLYPVAEGTAFGIAYDAMRRTFPEANVFYATGTVRGYQARVRPAPATMIVDVYVLPATGVDEPGRRHDGYAFEVHGMGMVSPHDVLRLRALRDQLQVMLQRQVAAIDVTNVRPSRYTSDGSAYSKSVEQPSVLYP